MNSDEIPTELSPGTILNNTWRIVRKLGQGKMGRVYEAVDVKTGLPRAIKQTFYLEKDHYEDQRDWFAHEKQILLTLNHPSIPKVHDFLDEGNNCFLIMDFIPGKNLEEVLKESGPLPPLVVIQLTTKILDALKHLHERKNPIIHRDIKPDNLKKDGDRVFLVDFGIAKDTYSGTLVFARALHFASLEQERGTPTDQRSDIYSLGATMYRLLTGLLPIRSLTRATALHDGRPDPLLPIQSKRVPRSLTAIVHKAMAVEPGDRFQSAEEMLDALRANDRFVQGELLISREQNGANLDNAQAQIEDEESSDEVTKIALPQDVKVLPPSVPAPNNNATAFGVAMMLLLLVAFVAVAFVLLSPKETPNSAGQTRDQDVATSQPGLSSTTANQVAQNTVATISAALPSPSPRQSASQPASQTIASAARTVTGEQTKRSVPTPRSTPVLYNNKEPKVSVSDDTSRVSRLRRVTPVSFESSEARISAHRQGTGLQMIFARPGKYTACICTEDSRGGCWLSIETTVPPGRGPFTLNLVHAPSSPFNLVVREEESGSCEVVQFDSRTPDL